MAKVLLIEDDESMAGATTSVLEQAGHTVVVAECGGLGMLELGRFYPDIVILDMMLPRINGWEFLDSKAASDPDVVNIPVIICSAWSNLPQPIPQNQRVVVLEKPIELNTLLQVVNDTLALK